MSEVTLEGPKLTSKCSNDLVRSINVNFHFPVNYFNVFLFLLLAKSYTKSLFWDESRMLVSHYLFGAKKLQKLSGSENHQFYYIMRNGLSLCNITPL